MKILDYIHQLVENGKEHRNKILCSLNELPVGEYSRLIPLDIRPVDQQQMILTMLESFDRWVGEIIILRALYDRRRISELSRMVRSALTQQEYKDPAIEDAEIALKELLSLAASIPIASFVDTQSTAPGIQKDSAFIIMAFGRRPDLQDTCNTIKRVCKLHGFDAFRADDFAGGIAIQRIHEWIASAEVVIGDLSLTRPNVMYEIGVANGKAKEPMLFRKKGTKLPFNLAAYNVPEYRSYTELENLLANRLKVLRN
jgi:hypothetical protein